MDTSTPPTLDTVYQCLACKKIFLTHTVLNEHKRIHKNYPCPDVPNSSGPTKKRRLAAENGNDGKRGISPSTKVAECVDLVSSSEDESEDKDSAVVHSPAEVLPKNDENVFFDAHVGELNTKVDIPSANK